jgi:hypothetical protein
MLREATLEYKHYKSLLSTPNNFLYKLLSNPSLNAPLPSNRAKNTRYLITLDNVLPVLERPLLRLKYELKTV